MAKQGKDNRINENIRAKSVRLIDENGEQAGILSIEEAIQKAKALDLDLVEVSPGASPPVCKLLDYGKYRFELDKKQRESKKKQKQVKLKEIRMQPKIEVHDLAFKVKHIQDFLEDGSKVKVTVRFRGRELAHTELGRNVLEEVMQKLEDTFILDSPPKMEGRFMNMLLSPSGKKRKDN